MKGIVRHPVGYIELKWAEKRHDQIVRLLFLCAYCRTGADGLS
ncbi:hypothetical protein PO124_20025 [Bacillus licheniformis]|nr:hypothetical protein [Bacillus licheniformis]